MKKSEVKRHAHKKHCNNTSNIKAQVSITRGQETKPTPKKQQTTRLGTKSSPRNQQTKEGNNLGEGSIIHIVVQKNMTQKGGTKKENYKARVTNPE